MVAKKTARRADRSAIYNRLADLAQGLGLQEPNIAMRLGSGLCRLWGLDPKGDRSAFVQRLPRGLNRSLLIYLRQAINRTRLLQLSTSTSRHIPKSETGYSRLVVNGLAQSERCGLGLATNQTLDTVLDCITGRMKFFPILSLELTPPGESSHQGEEFSDDLSKATGRTEASIPSEPTKQTDPLYVDREGLHNQIKQAVNAGAKLIVLHGLAGMGKTSLARGYTRLVTGADVPLIRVSEAKSTPMIFRELFKRAESQQSSLWLVARQSV